jgi:hypothetical protein
VAAAAGLRRVVPDRVAVFVATLVEQASYPGQEAALPLIVVRILPYTKIRITADCVLAIYQAHFYPEVCLPDLSHCWFRQQFSIHQIR